MAFLEYVDSGDLEGAYREHMSEAFKNNYSVERWQELSKIFRTPLGPATKRTGPSLGDGVDTMLWYQTMMYFTKFQNLKIPIQESITLASPGEPVQWGVIDYRVNVPPEFLEQQTQDSAEAQ
jgi:hypothetical protein